MEIIKDIKDRIQFLVTIEIFFLTLTYSFFRSVGSDELVSNKNAFAWGIGVAFCIVNYLLIGNFTEFKSSFLKKICWTISANIFFFIIPILIFASAMSNPLPSYYNLPFYLSLTGTLWMPIITTAFMVIGGTYFKFKK
ncbi:MAG: hypothetical protein AAB407_02930 [Patescibacteria group bacterium]